MAWTKEQEAAIYLRNNNIIVSAGAGSGKTAVLSERILQLVKEGRSVKNMLVLTFTNAAAKEMKDRIYKKLKENKYLDESFLVLNADITTFDAYSLKLVKKYFYLLGISKDIKIFEEELMIEKISEILDLIFERFYESKDERFIALLRHNLAKDDIRLKNNIVEIKRSLDLLINTEDVILNYEKYYFNEEKIKYLIEEYSKYIFSLLDKLSDGIDDLILMLEDEVDLNDKRIISLKEIKNNLEEISSYDDINLFLQNIKFPQLGKNYSDEANELKKELKAYSDFIKSEVIFDSISSIRENLLSMKEDILFILEIIKEINVRLKEYKDYYGIYSFMDISKMAIKLIKENKEVKEELLKLTDILVDEYQDTSDIQEAFIKEIENNNLYMVGDIKQSIYRFRNANPFIFKNKYDTYASKNGGLKIDLLKNFRSRSEVLDNINEIFKVIMTEEIGDADYINSHIMNYGLKEYDKEKDNQDYYLEDIRYEYEKESPYYKDFSRLEIEAFTCAKKIKELVSNTKTYDKDTKKLRDTKYSDIAILLATKSNFKEYERIFNYLGIPLLVCDDFDIKDSRFAHSILNLLLVSSYYYSYSYHDLEFKKSLNGLLRSFIFEYSDEDIYKIIFEGNEDSTKDLFLSIDYKKSPIDIYYSLLETFNVYDKLTKLNNINNSLVEIRTIGEKIIAYNDLGLDYKEAVFKLRDYIDSDKTISYKGDIVNDNQVKLMSIHHSKGLEFPYCFCLELSKSFNEQYKRVNSGFSNKYGIYLDSSDEKQVSVIKKLDNLLIQREDLSERIRVFYVALTRAREKLYFIRPITKEKKDILDCRCFNDFLNLVNLDKYKNVLDVNNLNISKKYRYVKEKNKENSDSIKLIDALENRFSSTVNKGQISMHKSSIQTKEEKIAMQLGTNVHEILESLDLKKPDLDSVDLKYRDKIKNLLNLDLFKNIKEAKIYQEYEFYFVNNNTTFNGIIDLLLEYDDRFVIIDYKLSDIDKPEYYDQLKVYYDYIRSISNKKIYVYLLSINKEITKELIYD